MKNCCRYLVTSKQSCSIFFAFYSVIYFISVIKTLDFRLNVPQVKSFAFFATAGAALAFPPSTALGAALREAVGLAVALAVALAAAGAAAGLAAPPLGTAV